MEDIYVNIQRTKPTCQIPAPNNRGSSSSKKRVYLSFISFGLLICSLLTALIILGVYFRDTSDLIAELSNIRDNLTKSLQASNAKLSYMDEERALLKANLTEMTADLNKLQSSRKQNACFQSTCLAGWIMFNRSCYFCSTKSGSWDEGRKDCRDRGTDLVVINNSDEQKFLAAFFKKQAWIGLNDKETEGVWKWVDGTYLNFNGSFVTGSSGVEFYSLLEIETGGVQYVRNWDGHQPDNGGGSKKWGEEDCVHANDDNKALWNDLSCTATKHWICEKVLTLDES